MGERGQVFLGHPRKDSTLSVNVLTFASPLPGNAMANYIRGRTRTLSDAEIVRAYNGGEDSNAIANRANCDASTVLYLVRRAGYPVRPRGPLPRKKLALSDAEIVRLYRDGLSGPVIADRAKTTAGTIYALLRRNGVQPRAPQQVATAAAAAARAARKRKELP